MNGLMNLTPLCDLQYMTHQSIIKYHLHQTPGYISSKITNFLTFNEKHFEKKNITRTKAQSETSYSINRFQITDISLSETCQIMTYDVRQILSE